MVDIASDLHTAGRNFSCTGEIVKYTCSGEGNTLFVNSPPFFNQHAFFSSDPAPSIVAVAPEVILTLQRGSPDYIANLQITVPNAQQMRINVSCSTNVLTSLNSLPLIHECKYLH